MYITDSGTTRDDGRRGYRGTSALGHSRPMHSVPVPINVRCYTDSDIIVRRSEVTLRANRVILHRRKTASLFAAGPPWKSVTDLQFEACYPAPHICSGHDPIGDGVNDNPHRKAK